MGWRIVSGAACLALLALACGKTNGGAGPRLDASAQPDAPRAGTVVVDAGSTGGTKPPATGGAGGAARAMGSGGAIGGMAGTATGGAAGASGGADAGAGAGMTGSNTATGGVGSGGAAGASSPACPVWPVTAAPAPAAVTLNGVTIASAEHDCTWDLGQAVALPTTSTHTRLLFHYDVNGDGVDDIYVGPNPADYMTKPRTITLLLSRLDAGNLSFEATDCALSPSLPDGQYALRDLDGDGVMDFVIAVENGFRIVMNRPGGLEQTASYDFPDTNEPQMYLGDVVLGAFEKNGTSEVAIGFLRQYDQLSEMESGTFLFPHPTQASTQAPVQLVTSTQPGNGWDQGMNSQLWYLTALQGGKALFGATEFDTWIYQGGQRTTTKNGNAWGVAFLSTITIGGRELVLDGAGSNGPPFPQGFAYAFDPNDSKNGTKIPSAYSHGFVYGRSRSFMLLDLDGDGDADLIETSAESVGGSSGVVKFAIHNGDPANGPSPQWNEMTPLQYISPNADSPFLAVGAVKGRILVSDGSAPHPPDGSPLLAMPVICKK